jgi:hypothetical protein
MKAPLHVFSVNWKRNSGNHKLAKDDLFKKLIGLDIE